MPARRAGCCTKLTRSRSTGARCRRRAAARLRVIGNLPYNIATKLLFRLLAATDAIRDMHFMLQKELVDRMVAVPGSRDYGRLTVMLAPHVRVTRLLDVGAGAFRPAPKVNSAVVRMTVNDSPPDWARLALYGPVVSAAFGQRRKTLRNALRQFLTAEDIHALGIDPGARAETLAPAQFGALAQAAASRARPSRRSAKLAATNLPSAARSAHDRLSPHSGRPRPDRGQSRRGRRAPANWHRARAAW